MKSLSYAAYRVVSEIKGAGYEYPVQLLSTGNYLDAINEFNDIFLGYFSKALDDIVRANPEIEDEDTVKVIGNTVFIVHGHDDHLKNEVQLLLTRAGVPNIVLHEQPDQGRTIIDKLIQEGQSANYAIALLSPDDPGTDGNMRARQNVILEIGFFMGLLGKERLRLLVKENIEIPSDLSGILYEKYERNGKWELKILKEIQAVGIFVDFDAVVKKL